MIRFISLIVSLVVWFSSNIRGESVESSKPLADPSATGVWLQSLFTFDKGVLLFCQKPFEMIDMARIPLAPKTEIQLRGSGVLINQEGLYPMCLGTDRSGFSMYMGKPFYAFLDYANGNDGLDGFAKNPKEAAMNHAGFRVIAEALHTHFTKLANDKPERHRVLDDLLYPSEHYFWKIGDIWVILSAYNGSDNNNICLTLTKDNKDIDKIRKMKPTDRGLYADWGEPLPYKGEAGSGQPAERTESNSEASGKPETEAKGNSK